MTGARWVLSVRLRGEINPTFSETSGSSRVSMLGNAAGVQVSECLVPGDFLIESTHETERPSDRLPVTLPGSRAGRFWAGPTGGQQLGPGNLYDWPDPYRRGQLDMLAHFVYCQVAENMIYF